MTSSGSTSGNIQNIALAPQVVQSPYGPMIPLLTQSGSVVLCSNSFIGSSTAITTTTSAITE